MGMVLLVPQTRAPKDVHAPIQCYYAPDNDFIRLGLGNQLLDHQYGSAACAGIARHLQRGSRKGKSGGFLQDLQPEEGTAWNSWTDAWEQISESSPCTYQHALQTYPRSHNIKVQRSCFHFDRHYTCIKGRRTSPPGVVWQIQEKSFLNTHHIEANFFFMSFLVHKEHRTFKNDLHVSCLFLLLNSTLLIRVTYSLVQSHLKSFQFLSQCNVHPHPSISNPS